MKDVVIIGAGPAGLSAAVYAKRAGLNSLLIEESPVSGGQVLLTYEVDNYLGLPGITGFELSEKFNQHANKLGVESETATVETISKEADSFKVVTSEGHFETKTVVLATGAKHAKLGVKGEEELSGMGVSYCATCDGAFFKNRDVCVVGGSDVAIEDAIFLARTSKTVYLIHRRDTFRAAKSLVDALAKCENVVYVLDSEVKEIIGEDCVERVLVHNKKTDENKTIDVQGVFIAVGIVPQTELVKDLVNRDEGGYVLASEDTRTSCKGIYVAGDIRKKPMRQIITAVADGANAVMSIQNDLM